MPPKSRSKVDDFFDSLPDAEPAGSEADALFAALPDAGPKMPEIHVGTDIEPDNSLTNEEAQARNLTRRPAPEAFADVFVDGTEALGGGIADRASFGYADELAGAAEVFDPKEPTDKTPAQKAVREDLGAPSFSEWLRQRYENGRDASRRTRDFAKERYPGKYGTGAAIGTGAGMAAAGIATGGAAFTPQGAGLLGYLDAVGSSDAPMASQETQDAAQNAALFGSATAGLARFAPVATGLAGGGLGAAAAAFGDRLGMKPDERVTAGIGGAASLAGAGAAGISKVRNYAAGKYDAKAMRAFDEAMEGRKGDLASAEGKLGNLADERGAKINAQAKALEAESLASMQKGRQQDEAVAMKAMAKQQAEIDSANDKFQRILREEAKLASQSKSGQQKFELARQKALSKLEAELAGIDEQAAAAGRSKEGAIGRGYQSDYAADHQYGDVPDGQLAPAALERRRLLAGKKADVANRRYQEPLPEERAQAEYEAALKALEAKRAALMQQLEQAKAPPKFDAPDALPEYALPGELVPQERIASIAKDLGLDASKYNPRSYKGLPLLSRGDDDKTGNLGHVVYKGDRRDESGTRTPTLPPRNGGASRQGVVDSAEKIARDAKQSAAMFKLQRRIDNQMKTVSDAKGKVSPESIAEDGAKSLQTYKDQQQVHSVPDAIRMLNPLAAPSGALQDPAARFSHFSQLAAKLGTDKSLAQYVPMLEQAAVMSNAPAAMRIYESIIQDPAVQAKLEEP